MADRPMQPQQTTVRGVPMRWKEAGEGYPVVLVHGLPTGPALWRHVVRLTQGARCVAFEMVGYADSIPAGRDRDISVARQAEYLLALLAELGIERAVYAGHDLGGGVVQIAALREPQRCAGLVLTNSIGYDSWPIPSVRVLQVGRQVLARLPDAAVRAVFATLMARGHDNPATGRESGDLHLEPYLRYGAGEALARQVAWLRTDDTLAVAGRLGELAVPARVVWGAADPFLKVSYGERFAWDLGAPLRRLEDARHFTPEDRPTEIARAVNEVVTEVTR